ncbi:hypothetical protein VTN77DRAFT_6376 [Rasamsonia byssochlamydoides]|uniref:uncharacterized protein n=1 Tax=Rasamsonia byssochlamydoides TaxID=89139 RepID=UPI0037425E9A
MLSRRWRSHGSELGPDRGECLNLAQPHRRTVTVGVNEMYTSVWLLEMRSLSQALQVESYLRGKPHDDTTYLGRAGEGGAHTNREESSMHAWIEDLAAWAQAKAGRRVSAQQEGISMPSGNLPKSGLLDRVTEQRKEGGQKPRVKPLEMHRDSL